MFVVSQVDMDMSKRDWNKNLKMWGKRSWQSLHGGWGLKRDSGSWDNNNRNDAPSLDEKRAWKNLQVGYSNDGPNGSEVRRLRRKD